MTSLYPKLFQDHSTRYISVDHGKIKIPDNIFRPDLRFGWRKRGEREEYSIFCRPASRVNTTLDLGFASVIDPPNPRSNAASAIYYLPNDLSFAPHPRVALCVPLGSKYRDGLSSRDIPSIATAFPSGWWFSRRRARSKCEADIRISDSP